MLRDLPRPGPMQLPERGPTLGGEVVGGGGGCNTSRLQKHPKKRPDNER